MPSKNALKRSHESKKVLCGSTLRYKDGRKREYVCTIKSIATPYVYLGRHPRWSTGGFRKVFHQEGGFCTQEGFTVDICSGDRLYSLRPARAEQLAARPSSARRASMIPTATIPMTG